MYDIIVDGIIVSAISFVVLVVNSFIFRTIVNRLAFLGKDKAETKRFVLSHEFKVWFTMGYIKEIDPDENEGVELAKWFRLFYLICVTALFTAEMFIWADKLIHLANGQRIYIDSYFMGFHMTWESIDDILGIIVLGALPVSLVLALPAILRIRTDRDDFLRLKKKG